MRSKQGVDYCVACNELDSDDVKDNPGITLIIMVIISARIFAIFGIMILTYTFLSCHKFYKFGGLHW